MSFTNANLPKPVMLNSCNSLAAAQELASAAGLDVPDASVFVWSFLLLWDRSSRAGNKDEETGTARDSAQEVRFTWIQKWEKEVDWSGRRFFMFHILIPQKQTLSENMASSCHKVSDTHPLQIWPEGQWSHTSQRGVEIKFCPGWKRQTLHGFLPSHAAPRPPSVWHSGTNRSLLLWVLHHLQTGAPGPGGWG